MSVKEGANRLASLVGWKRKEACFRVGVSSARVSVGSVISDPWLLRWIYGSESKSGSIFSRNVMKTSIFIQKWYSAHSAQFHSSFPSKLKFSFSSCNPLFGIIIVDSESSNELTEKI